MSLFVANIINSNVEKRMKKYLDILDYLKDTRFNLLKMDKSSAIYKILSETQLAYTYVEIVLQCKMNQEIEIVEFLGRPAFLWSDQQLIAKLKRKHTIKSVPLYLQRMEFLIQMGLIVKVPFNEIDAKIIALLNESLRIEKPNLYIMVDITPFMMSKIPYYDIDFDLVNLKIIQEKEREEKLQKILKEKNERRKTKNKKTSNKTTKQPSQQIKPAITKTNKLMDLKNQQINGILKKKLLEYTNYNIREVNSNLFSTTFKRVDDFLKQNNLKSLYCEILNYNSKINRIHQFEYEKNPVFFIEKETIARIYRDTYNKSITSREVSILFDKICKIGMLQKMSSSDLAMELGISKQNLIALMRESSFPNFTSSSEFYILLRLDELLWRNIENKVNIINDGLQNIEKTNKIFEEQEDISKVFKNQEKVKKTEKKFKDLILDEIQQPEGDILSVTECAIEILIESKIEGNKVIIDKSQFDRLIQSILGEVPFHE